MLANLLIRNKTVSTAKRRRAFSRYIFYFQKRMQIGNKPVAINYHPFKKS